MGTKWVTVPSLLVQITQKDALFGGTHTLDPYQRCSFQCRYCDSADATIEIKENAVSLLQQELSTLTDATIIIGSVHDPYQPIESHQQVTRSLIECLCNHGSIGCHILTKSSLILRDIDLLQQLKECTVTISLSTMDPSHASLCEPHVPPPEERLNTCAQLLSNDISTGVALMPFLPKISEQSLPSLFSKLSSIQPSHFNYKMLELKGEEKQQFLDFINTYFPEYYQWYHQNFCTTMLPAENYRKEIDTIIQDMCTKYNLPIGMK